MSMNSTSLKVLSFFGKAAAFIAGLSIYAGALPEAYVIPAGLVFAFASLTKDNVNRAGDLLDNGKEDGSFRSK